MNLLNKELIKDICNISIEAGQIINKFYKSENFVILKNDKSPLTKADIESNNYIINSLNKLNSQIPILTEEKLVDWNIRKKWNKYWLVDPLDGTKEFINQNDEFTVNIALIENNEPILGVIYAPAISLLYYASKNYGSYKITCKKKIDSLSNSQRINTNINKKTNSIIIQSRSHTNKQHDNWVNKNFKDSKIVKKGSSLKFCEIAEGKADIYPRFGPTSEWDIAAGHIILNESGGKIRSIDNKKILYNLSESVTNPSFIASSIEIKNV